VEPARGPGLGSTSGSLHRPVQTDGKVRLERSSPSALDQGQPTAKVEWFRGKANSMTLR
jgi:hypothetical protein